MSSGAREVPFDGSYWVDSGGFLAGLYPGAFHAESARLRVEALLEAGVRCIVNLTEELEAGDPRSYEELFVSVANERGLDVRILSFPIPDMDVPSGDLMVRILDAIDGSIDDGQPVYVHCLAGLGRTGTVVGCWLSRHGIASGDAVMSEIASLRGDDGAYTWSSPVTQKQCDFVRGWEEGR